MREEHKMTKQYKKPEVQLFSLSPRPICLTATSMPADADQEAGVKELYGWNTEEGSNFKANTVEW